MFMKFTYYLQLFANVGDNERDSPGKNEHEEKEDQPERNYKMVQGDQIKYESSHKPIKKKTQAC